MKFTLSNVNYEVKWSYEYYDPEIYTTSVVTRCRITTDEDMIGYGDARCSVKDRFNRRDGMKLTLMRALQSRWIP